LIGGTTRTENSKILEPIPGRLKQAFIKLMGTFKEALACTSMRIITPKAGWQSSSGNPPLRRRAESILTRTRYPASIICKAWYFRVLQLVLQRSTKGVCFPFGAAPGALAISLAAPLSVRESVVEGEDERGEQSERAKKAQAQ
jgi:hypothetical protein